MVPLLLVAVLLANWSGAAGDIHPISRVGKGPDRPTMVEAFEYWLAQPNACTSTLTFDHRQVDVRPMLMVAAEGGGLRASYWTAAALEAIADATEGCGRSTTLFSAGASGGAFGLTLARFTENPLESVRSIAGSHALGAASASLLGADLLASATGIRLESDTPTRALARSWLDRAGQMETVWEEQVGLPDNVLFLPLDPSAATSDTGAGTGHLILTSTVVRSACRALLSQVDLGSTRTDCPGSSGPRSFDFFAPYGACLHNLPALTGGLLASRFPYVTPSASVEECGDNGFEQLVDGGYSDNSGLATILNLAPQWRPLVQAHNEQVLTGGSGPLVVPVIVYLENGTGSDFGVSIEESDEDPPDDRDDQGPAKLDWAVTPEALVPPATWYRGRGHEIGVLESLETAQGLVRAAICRPEAGNCGVLRDAVEKWREARVFVVHQSAQPTLSAPLGWVLSEASQEDLDADLAEQLRRSCADLETDPGCRAGYANLHDLVAMLTG